MKIIIFLIIFSFILTPFTFTYAISLEDLAMDNNINMDGLNIEGIDLNNIDINDILTAPNKKFISGFLKDESGSVITGVDVQVFAISEGLWRVGILDTSTGVYVITIDEGEVGDWYLGVYVPVTSGYMSRLPLEEAVRIGENDKTVNRDITLFSANAQIIGRVVNSDSIPLKGVWVEAKKRSIVGEKAEDFIASLVNGDLTDENGEYSFVVPSGGYFVGAFLSHKEGYINPDEQAVELVEGGAVTLNFIFKQSDVTISGKIKTSALMGINAFVWAWSDNGGFAETQASSDGSYSLNVSSNDIWHIGVAKEIGSDLYKKEDTVIEVQQENVTVPDIIINLTQITLPQSLTQIRNIDIDALIVLDNGASLNVPAGSVTNTSHMEIKMTPQGNIPSQGVSSRVVGFSYDVGIRDASGIDLKNFGKYLTIILPYSDEMLSEAGVNEEELVLSFWDDAISRWIELPQYAVDKVNNIVMGRFDHLTRFAIVAPADTTPPSAPTNISITKSGNNSLILSWSNTVIDFHHVKIYRSTQSGNIGTIVFNDVMLTSKKNSGLIAGTRYYYTIRTIDIAGNESVNTSQYSEVPGGALEVSAPGGELIRLVGGTKVYRIENGQKHWIPTGGVFNKLGLNWGDISEVSRAGFDSYPRTKLIRVSADLKVYYLTESGMIRHIPSVEVFVSYGSKWESVIEISTDELLVYSVNDIIRVEGGTKVYKLEAGMKRWIETAATFIAKGYKWENIAPVNQTEINTYPEGSVIE